MSNPLRLVVADLLRRPGASRAVRLRVPLGPLAGAVVELGEIEIEVVLERVSDGIVVRGDLGAPWSGACSRCLAPVSGEVHVHVDELYEPSPLDDETYRLDDDVLDLEPVVRDGLALELPAVPRCRPECAGLCPDCGADRNVTNCRHETTSPDPRWAALQSLDL